MCRVAQGVGGALMLGVAPKLISLAFPERERGFALGMFSAGFATGVTMGAPLGGLILTYLNWRALFFVNPLLGMISSWSRQPGVKKISPAPDLGMADPGPLGRPDHHRHPGRVHPDPHRGKGPRRHGCTQPAGPGGGGRRGGAPGGHRAAPAEPPAPPGPLAEPRLSFGELRGAHGLCLCDGVLFSAAVFSGAGL